MNVGDMVQIHCDGCGTAGEYTLGVGMLGSAAELACCRSCAELVEVWRDRIRDQPDDRCAICGGVVEGPYPEIWERSEDGDETAPGVCPKCGAASTPPVRGQLGLTEVTVTRRTSRAASSSSSTMSVFVGSICDVWFLVEVRRDRLRRDRRRARPRRRARRLCSQSWATERSGGVHRHPEWPQGGVRRRPDRSGAASDRHAAPGAGDGRRRAGADRAGQSRVQRDRLRHADRRRRLVPAARPTSTGASTRRSWPRSVPDSPVHRYWIDWFRTIPLWLDLGGLRVVHACWHPASMAVLGDGTLTDAMVAAPKGSADVRGDRGRAEGSRDRDGRRGVPRQGRPPPGQGAVQVVETRCRARCGRPPRSPATRTPRRRRSPFAAAAGHRRSPAEWPSAPTDVPVLYGHYWRSGTPSVDVGGKSACLDWSVAKGGPLVAYRWSGESELVSDNLVEFSPAGASSSST